MITVNVKRPAKALVLQVEGEDNARLSWSDNGIDVMPGDPQIVSVSRRDGEGLQINPSNLAFRYFNNTA